MNRHLGPLLLGALLAGSGVLHLVKPGPYRAIVPRVLPAPGALVAVSGVAELGCAALVAVPATRRWGGWASALLFVAVFPANVQMALDWNRRRDWRRTAAWARLPLQVPLVWWAWRTAHQPAPKQTKGNGSSAASSAAAKA